MQKAHKSQMFYSVGKLHHVDYVCSCVNFQQGKGRSISTKILMTIGMTDAQSSVSFASILLDQQGNKM